MALRHEVDTLDGLPAAVREHYTRADTGRYVLALVGEHPKVTEFRTKNVEQAKELDQLRDRLKQFEGMDPAEVAAETAALRARVTELETEAGTTVPKLAALEADLTAERTAHATEREAHAAERIAHAATRDKVGRALLRETVGARFLAVGGQPAAVEMALDRAEKVFTVADGRIVARPDHYSRNRPGEALTVDDWLDEAGVDTPFLFKPSVGGGAPQSRPRSSSAAATSGRVLVNPSPADLGRHAAAIKRGDIRIQHTDD